jgi:hypothetical protein
MALLRRIIVPLVAVGALVAGCSTASGPSGNTADSGAGSGGGDFSGCTTPLGDAGFSTLAELPVAQICARLGSGQTLMKSDPCQGWVWVTETDGVDCASDWVFDPSGNLQVFDTGCDVIRCTMNPGAQPPKDFCSDQRLGEWNLCPAAAADAGANQD